MNCIEAAQSLILTLNNQPAIGHAIWVATDVDPDTKEFRQVIKMAVRPSYANRIKVPKEHQGHPVVQEPWPEGA